MLDKLGRFCAAVPVAAAMVVASNTATVTWMPAATILGVGGIGFPTASQETMKAVLGGLYDDGINTFVNVPWPGQAAPVNGTLKLGESIAIGTDNLYAAIMDTPGPKMASGVSGSTMVINEVMRRLMGDPNAPDPDDMSFLVVGDAERGILPALTPFVGRRPEALDYTVLPPPVTPYDVTVVTGEYDGLADWPDRPWNLLAVFNALAGTGIWPGFRSAHWEAIWKNPTTLPGVSVTQSVNYLGGVTTSYLIPTPELPMLNPLRAQGVSEDTIKMLNAVLKPLVDAGYSRNDFRAVPPPLPRGRDQSAPSSAAAINSVPASSAAVRAVPVSAAAAKGPVAKSVAAAESASPASARRASSR